MKYIVLILTVLFCLNAFSQDKKQAQAVRIQESSDIKINASLDEAEWKNAKIIHDFIQYEPDYLKQPRFKTEVRILYDNQAIYIAAQMFDPYPDSILTQLGNRDDELNSDYFQIAFDTYNRQQDAFFFKVYASGVQSDFREEDYTFNAIWESKVKVDEKGWTAELRIPYSAIRFSETDQQIWGMQIERSVRRFREKSNWAIEEKGADNFQSYWGTLEGIENIESPLRLSFMPYISGAAVYEDKQWGSDFHYGLDLKYGINESFTLDMILLPDFSQVKSDRQVKNLSAFEVEYGEQRQFFQEATDLFEKGDLFYSRRIGRKPSGYYSVYDKLNAGDEITYNPNAAALLNASKVSGRFDNGLAVGIFNAVTNRMQAEITDSLGNKRNEITEALTNYNIVVLDKAMKNNSSVYFINTNTTRSDAWKGSNVSGVGTNLIDKSNSWELQANGAVSFKESNLNPLTDSLSSEPGYKYDVAFNRIKGHFQFEVEHSLISDNWDNNDLGITHINNQMRNSGEFAYKIFEPWWFLRKVNFQLSFTEKHNLTTGKNNTQNISYHMFGITKGYLSFWGGVNIGIKETYDYYEARSSGRYFKQAPSEGLYFGYSSDYRKRLALDGNINLWKRNEEQNIYLQINPIIRLSDKLTLDYDIAYTNNLHNKGYSGNSNGDIYFGQRDLRVIENSLNGRYMFMNNLSLGLSVRHYWSVGVYDAYYLLNLNGELNQMRTSPFNNDFNFNAFNVDVNFSWEFAPGSLLNFNYKNEIVAENDKVGQSYYYNFSHTFREDQLSRFSLKLVYYLDYQQLKRRKKTP